MMYEEMIKKQLKPIKSKPILKDEAIACAEALGLSFGEEYLTFLREFGCLSVGYMEFYGICGDNNSTPSTLFVTQKIREEIEGFPSDLFVVYENGDGTFYAADAQDSIYLCEYNKCQAINKSFKYFVLEKIDAYEDL